MILKAKKGFKSFGFLQNDGSPLSDNFPEAHLQRNINLICITREW